MPRLPPAKLMANLVGVTSDFIEARRAWLVRWLTIVTSHPVTRGDGMLRCSHPHSEHRREELKGSFRIFARLKFRSGSL